MQIKKTLRQFTVFFGAVVACAVMAFATSARAEVVTCPVTINGETFTANLKSGKRAFLRCRSCHTLEAGGKNRVGPNLAHLFDRGPAAAEGFAYSKALTDGQISWNNDNLDAFLEKPSKFLPGTKMVFMGLRKPQDRADVIAHLQVNTTEDGKCLEGS